METGDQTSSPVARGDKAGPIQRVRALATGTPVLEDRTLGLSDRISCREVQIESSVMQK